MDNGILKKRLNTFKSGQKGQLLKVSDDVVLDVLRTWENNTGTSKSFYQSLGLGKHQLTALIKRGKQLIKSGVVQESEFRELGISAGAVLPSSTGGPCQGVELMWDGGKVIRFPQVDQLLEFLKKVA